MVKYRRSFSLFIAVAFQTTLAETIKNETRKRSILQKINDCTFQILSLFTYENKLQQHLYKTDIGVLIVIRNMKAFWDQKHQARKVVFFKKHLNARLNKIFNKELQKKKPEILRKFFIIIKDYENEEEKQIKLELTKEKVTAQWKLQDIYKKLKTLMEK